MTMQHSSSNVGYVLTERLDGTTSKRPWVDAPVPGLTAG